jgi:hypothetical protein
MRRWQIVVAWRDWSDPTIEDRRLFFVNAKNESEAIAIFHKDLGERHRIIKILDRGAAK